MPFIETALIGDDSIENINHYGGIRLRLNGTGNLLMKLISLDNVISSELMPLPISDSGRELLRLSNFNSQRALLRIETTKIGEHFDINRIIFFIKPTYTSYPGNV